MSIMMIGAFPPPVRGMPLVNAAIRDRLMARGERPTVIDLVAPGIELSFSVRARRFLNVLAGFGRCAAAAYRHDVVYLSVSGGAGKLYDCVFCLIARLSGSRVYLHHHSFAYLQRSHLLARLLCRIGGRFTQHVVQSEGMARRLQNLYGARRVHVVSNAVFLPAAPASGYRAPRRASGQLTLGHISNLSAEKGVFRFLDLLESLQHREIDVRGVLAGPFQNAATERAVLERLRRMHNARWIGSVHGEHKDAFFASIDVLIFPSLYANETEGIVNHEAMRCGVPVIAYGQGCIPEIVARGAGLVVPPDAAFTEAAALCLDEWRRSPRIFAEAQEAARAQFVRIRASAERNLSELLEQLGAKEDAVDPTRTIRSGTDDAPPRH